MSKEVWIELNGEKVKVPERITVKNALEMYKYRISKYPEEGSLFMPCEGMSAQRLLPSEELTGTYKDI